MKGIALALTALCILGAPSMVANPKEALDWSSCQKAKDALRDSVARLQATLPDGLKLELSCMYAGTVEERKRLPERHIPLTQEEANSLNNLRYLRDAAFGTLSGFEDRLIAIHHLPHLEYGDPCYRFIGFKVDDNFITDDPNPFMPWACQAFKERTEKK